MGVDIVRVGIGEGKYEVGGMGVRMGGGRI